MTPRAVMWTIAQIAERDGVSKQAISKAVQRLVERHGLAVERDAQGRVATVNVVAFDQLRGRYSDPSKAQAPRVPAPIVDDAPPVSSTESYDEALRQKTWHEAESKRLALATAKGELVKVVELDDAVVLLADALVGVFDELPARADDIATAVTRGGLPALRNLLKKITAEQRARAADALQQLASDITDRTREPSRQ